MGIDRSYYEPLDVTDLTAYAAELPRGFPTISKVWDEVTTFVFADHPRHGARAGKKNARFLDPGVMTAEILPAYAEAFAAHTGPFVFELPRVHNLTATEQGEVLARPRPPPSRRSRRLHGYAVRAPHTRALDRTRYLDTLRAHGAAHVLNYWTGMPDLALQMTVAGVLTAPFVVARAMIPPGVRYEDAKAAFAPFDRIVTKQPGMRRDIAELAARCADEGER